MINLTKEEFLDNYWNQYLLLEDSLELIFFQILNLS